MLTASAHDVGGRAALVEALEERGALGAAVERLMAAVEGDGPESVQAAIAVIYLLCGTPVQTLAFEEPIRVRIEPAGSG